ncbi:MAG: hypothetical protein BMS9Abin26_0904 [Gammaproteobacteria bacterium]|nr:MAG: hypothetical protein BMS9Abin26_0904 [Gammaproteobacteria bacterium]
MLITGSTATHLWQRLIREAQDDLNCPLGEELEAYLVLTLGHYTRQPALGQRILSLDYLNAMQPTSNGIGNSTGHVQALREVGDHCLLTSGLFPQRARRRRVQVSYYVDLGRSAYDSLSMSMNNTWSRLYQQMSEGFVVLMDILQAMRPREEMPAWLSPLEAHELWRDTGARVARRVLTDTSVDADPAAGMALSQRRQ